MQKFLIRILYACALLCIGLQANAHNPNETYIYLEAVQGNFGGVVHVSVEDAGKLFALDADENGATSQDEVVTGKEVVWQALSERMMFEIGEDEVTATFTELTFLGEGEGAIAEFNFSLDYHGEVPERLFITLENDLGNILAGHGVYALVRANSRIGLTNNEAYVAHIFGSGTEKAEISLLGDPPIRVFTRFVEQGIWHILIGFDHVAFLLALLLTSVLVATAQKWVPADNLRTAGWSIFKIATVFTIAHSVTLSVSALGIYVPSETPIEIIIALSIVAAALINILLVRPALALPMVFLLGLVHGFGFSFVMEPLGVARSTLVQSLLGFNIGVELGQLAIIIVVFPILYVLRRKRFYVPVVLRGGSFLLILVAFYWFGERALNYFDIV